MCICKTIKSKAFICKTSSLSLTKSTFFTTFKTCLPNINIVHLFLEQNYLKKNTHIIILFLFGFAKISSAYCSLKVVTISQLNSSGQFEIQSYWVLFT